MIGIQLIDNFKKVYPIPALPIGYIYMSYELTSPAEIFGGEWIQLTNCFLFGAGSNYVAGQTGGEEEVILTVDNLPSHTHSMTAAGGYDTNRGQLGKTKYSGSGTYSSDGFTGYTGGGESHNNMPPYYSVYMWEKIG